MLREFMLNTINPITDARWGNLVDRHPRSSAFHSVAWLQALQRTYGFESIVLTSAQAGQELQNGVVFCRVDSWLTGNRMVSLPFSDHCDPLEAEGENPSELLGQAMRQLAGADLKYVEARPLRRLEGVAGLECARRNYWFHALDLEPSLETLFGAFHKDSIQRKIRRAEREGLIYQEGRSEELLEHFYQLMILTRRRHQLPPHPRSWFRNLAAVFGDAVKIRVTFQQTRPTAAMLTLQHGRAMVYKYGASDAALNNLGGTPLLMWRTIQDAKAQGLETLDLGRSDLDGDGLVQFKNRFGAVCSEISYFRHLVRPGSVETIGGWKEDFARHAVGYLPDSVLSKLSAVLYRHAG